jgi:hypothetical protein
VTKLTVDKIVVSTLNQSAQVTVTIKELANWMEPVPVITDSWELLVSLALMLELLVVNPMLDKSQISVLTQCMLDKLVI